MFGFLRQLDASLTALLVVPLLPPTVVAVTKGLGALHAQMFGGLTLVLAFRLWADKRLAKSIVQIIFCALPFVFGVLICAGALHKSIPAYVPYSVVVVGTVLAAISQLRQRK